VTTRENRNIARPARTNVGILHLLWYRRIDCTVSKQKRFSIVLQSRLPSRDGTLKDDVFIEAVRCILGLPSHILKPFADEHHFIGRNATMVDAHGSMVKNAMLINGDYHRMHASIQSLIIDMFKKANIWAIREPQNMLHGLVPAEILKQYCDHHSIQEFIIPDIMTYDHPHRERSGRMVLQRRIFEVKGCE